MDFNSEWDIEATAQFLSRGYSRAALQFPDEYLVSCKAVASALHDTCERLGHKVQVFILADTSYNSSGVDEVAAQHADADCVVHYGEASLSALSRLPAYFVFRAAFIDVKALAKQLMQYSSSLTESAALCNLSDLTESKKQAREASARPCAVLAMLDQPYAHALTELRSQIDSLQLKQRKLQHEQARDDNDDSCKNSNAAADTELAIIVTSACGGLLTPSQDSRLRRPHERCCQAEKLPSGAPAATVERPQSHCCGQSQSRDFRADAASGCAAPSDHQSLNTESSSHTDRPNSVDSPASAPRDPSSGPCKGRYPCPEGCALSSAAAALTWQLPNEAALEEAAVVWVGDGKASTLKSLQLAHASATWFVLDPVTMQWQHGVADDLRRTLQRRYFLVEKARNANIVGILVGTLGVAGYLQAIDRLRDLIHQAGKKTYTFLMGKPNPSKLANFPEVDIFVMIAAPEGLILDSREYYAPIISAYEAHVAFSPGQNWTGTYRLDFQCLLQQGEDDEHAQTGTSSDSPRMSLLDGQLYGGSESVSAAKIVDSTPNLSLAVRPQSHMMSTPGGKDDITTAAQYLHSRRTYVGLHDHLADASPKPSGAITIGRVGRAAGYSEEVASSPNNQ